MTSLPIENPHISAWYLEAVKKVLNQRGLSSPTDDLSYIIVAIYGSGPFLDKEFEDFLESYNLTYDLMIASAPSAFGDFLESYDLRAEGTKSGSDNRSILLIVGHHEWDENKLVDLVDIGLTCNGNNRLNVYSQEMFLFYLMTGIDPFDAPRDVLEVFGSDHPALDTLAHIGFDWPSSQFEDLDIEADSDIEVVPPRVWSESSPLSAPQNASSDNSSSYAERDSYYPDNGILKACEYEVGKSGITDPRERKSKLREIFYMKDLPELPGVRLEDWGRPGSEERLRKMAYCLAYFVKNPQNQTPSKVVARKNWEHDLAWLKEEFYASPFSFRWPTTVW